MAVRSALDTVDLRPATSPAAQITMEAEVSGSLRRTPSRPPRSALGLDGVALRAGASGKSASGETIGL